MLPRSLTYQDNKSFFLFGPRGVGKTKWLRSTFPNDLYFDLLDARTYSLLLADPTRLGERVPPNYSDWVILDEVQRVPCAERGQTYWQGEPSLNICTRLR